MKSFLFVVVSLIMIPAFAHASSSCEVRLRSGAVVKAPLEIEGEHGSPVASGSAKLAGIEISFESGWGGVSEEKGGTEKYEFHEFTVLENGAVLAHEDVGATGFSFERTLENHPRIAKVSCKL